MPALKIIETRDSRELKLDNKGATALFKYMAYRSFDELAVHAAVLAYGPNTYTGLVKRSCEVAPLGGGCWNGQVLYEWPEGVPLVGQGGAGPKPSPDSSGTPGEHQALGFEFQFDTAGGTEHITRSLETVSRTAITGDPKANVAPDCKRVIGVTDDGKIAGCDVGTGKLEFSISRRLPFITLAYIKDLKFATYRTNFYTFLGFPAGSLLFLGASGQWRDHDGWTVNYKFSAAENETNIDVRGDGKLTVPAKAGWDYLWLGYRDEKDFIAGRTVKRPYCAYVEKVYKTVDLKLYLGWGA